MKSKRMSIFAALLAVFLLVTVLALGGCDTAAPPDDDDDENGAPAPDPSPDPDPELKVLHSALNNRPPTLDPHNHRSADTGRVVEIYAEALTKLMPNGEHVLHLAESIDEVEPGVYMIKIREGVIFHNGDPLTADDVVFSFTRAAAPGGLEGDDSAQRRQIGMVETVEKVDDYTVRITLEAPRPLTQYASWVYCNILPKNYFEEVGGIQGFIDNPIGSGPYKWVEGDEVTGAVFEKYDDYWGDAPKIDRVILSYIREESTRIAALLAGDIDMMTDVGFDSVEMLNANPNIEVASGIESRIVIMSINNQKEPLSDRRVRQALAYAINYEAISEGLTVGMATPLHARPFLPPFEGTPGHGAFDHIEGYEYNPEKARDLLEEAGATGFSIVIDSIQPLVEVSQAIAQMWSDVGINASVRQWEFAMMSATWREDNHNRDVYLSRFSNMDRFPEYILNQVAADSAQNRARYRNEYVEELFAQAGVMTEDSPDRSALIAEALEIVTGDVPCIFVWSQGDTAAWSKRVVGYEPCIRSRENPQFLDVRE